MKLELKHLSTYLPYKLTLMVDGIECRMEGFDLHTENTVIAERTYYLFEEIKPILRPFTDLTDKKAISILGFDKIDDEGYKQIYNLMRYGHEYTDCTRWDILDPLIEWKYDIFGLIDEGLAIDINTIK